MRHDLRTLAYAFGWALYLTIGTACGSFVLLVALAVLTAR